MTTLAVDSEPDCFHASRSGYSGVAVKAGAHAFRGLLDAKRFFAGTRRARAMAQGKVEAAGFGVVTDAVLQPLTVPFQDGSDALIARSEGEHDLRAGDVRGGAFAHGDHFEGRAFGRVGQQIAAAGFADRPIPGESLCEFGFRGGAQGTGMIGGGVRGGLFRMAAGAIRRGRGGQRQYNAGCVDDDGRGGSFAPGSRCA